MWLYADIQNVPDIVRYYGRVTPHKVALLEGGFSLTYGDLDGFTSLVAQAWLQEVQPKAA